MTKEQIVNEVIAYVRTLVRNDVQDEITAQTRILSDQVIDSLGIIQLVAFIETKFNIKIEQADLNLDNLDSAERMANYVLRKKQ